MESRPSSTRPRPEENLRSTRAATTQPAHRPHHDPTIERRTTPYSTPRVSRYDPAWFYSGPVSLESRATRAVATLPSSVEHWTVRGVAELSEQLSVRLGVAEAPRRMRDVGVMVSVVDGGQGHAATSDVSEAGLRLAFDEAGKLARAAAGKSVFDPRHTPRPQVSGGYRSKVERSARDAALTDKLALLARVAASARISDCRSVAWSACRSTS